jgi:hypothetical protein
MCDCIIYLLGGFLLGYALSTLMQYLVSMRMVREGRS